MKVEWTVAAGRSLSSWISSGSRGAAQWLLSQRQCRQLEQWWTWEECCCFSLCGHGSNVNLFTIMQKLFWTSHWPLTLILKTLTWYPRSLVTLTWYNPESLAVTLTNTKVPLGENCSLPLVSFFRIMAEGGKLMVWQQMVTLCPSWTTAEGRTSTVVFLGATEETRIWCGDSCQGLMNHVVQ